MPKRKINMKEAFHSNFLVNRRERERERDLIDIVILLRDFAVHKILQS